MTTVTKTIWIGFTASILLLLIRQCDAFVTSAWGGGSVRARPAPCLPVPPARTVVGVNRRILQLRPVVKSSLANIIISSSALYQKSDGLAEKLTLDGVEIRGPIAAVQNVLIVKLKDTLLATGGGILLPDQSKEKPTEGLVVASGPGRIHPHTGIRLDNPIRPGMSVLL